MTIEKIFELRKLIAGILTQLWFNEMINNQKFRLN